MTRPGTREGRQRQRVPVALTMTSPSWQPQTSGARAAPGGRMSPGRSSCASGWIALLFCARVLLERAWSRRCLMAKDGEGGDGSGRGSAPQLQRLPREAGVGVRKELPGLRRQAGNPPRPPSNSDVLSQSKELLKCRSWVLPPGPARFPLLGSPPDQAPPQPFQSLLGRVVCAVSHLSYLRPFSTTPPHP